MRNFNTLVLYLGNPNRIAAVRIQNDQAIILKSVTIAPRGSEADGSVQQLKSLSEDMKTLAAEFGIEQNVAIIDSQLAHMFEMSSVPSRQIPEVKELQRSKEMFEDYRCRFLPYAGSPKGIIFECRTENSKIEALREALGTQWNLHYVSCIEPALMSIKYKEIDGFVELDGNIRITLTTASAFRVYDLKAGIWEAIQLIADSAGVLPEVISELYVAIGNSRAPRYSELLKQAGVSEKDYYDGISLVDDVLKPGWTVVEQAFGQRSKLKLAFIGNYARANGVVVEHLPIPEIECKCKCPGQISFGENVIAESFSRENAIILGAIQAMLDNSANFVDTQPTAPKGGVIMESVEEVEVKKDKLFKKNKQPKIAIPPRGSEKIPRAVSIPEEVVEPLHVSEIQMQMTNEPVAAKQYLAPETPEQPATEILRGLQQTNTGNFQLRKYNLAANLLIIGVILMIIGIISYFGTASTKAFIPAQEQIKQLETRCSELTNQIESRSNINRIHNDIFSRYIPYIKFIGKINDANVTITDFNLIGDVSLRISGTSSNEENFRQFKKDLESISVNMNVILVNNEKTAADQVFTFEISCKEVPNVE